MKAHTVLMFGVAAALPACGGGSSSDASSPGASDAPIAPTESDGSSE